MSKGIVYILTNPCLDGWVKIGMTERNDVERRLQELNSPTNIPLSYRCYAVYEVNNPLEVEKRIIALSTELMIRYTQERNLITVALEKENFSKYRPKQHMVFSRI